MAGSIIFQVTDELAPVTGTGTLVGHITDEFTSLTGAGSIISLATPAIGIPDLLVSKHKGAGNAAVYTLSGGVNLTQIGSDFSIASLETPSATNNPVGRVVEFKGLRLVWHRDTIREENTGGAGVWGTIFSVPNFSGNQGLGLHSGLYEVQVNGVPTLIGAYQRTANSDFNVVRSTNGTAWTVEDSLLDTVDSSIGRATVYRNELYWFTLNVSNRLIRYSPQLSSASRITVPGTTSNKDFAVHNNDLFLVGGDGTAAGSLYKLWKLQGAFFGELHSFTGVTNGGSGEQGGCVAFSQGSSLYVILVGSSGNPMFKIDNPGEATQVVTEITDPVIPTEFRSGGGSANEINRWFSFVNNNSRPLLPEVYLWRLTNFASGTYEAFEFVNDFTELVSLGTGLSSDIYLPNTNTGGGERIYAINKVYAEIELHTAVATGTEISYRVYESTSNVTVEFYYSLGEETPNILMSLTGTATGGSSSRSGNTVIDVTPDDGTTLYTVIWDIATDGVAEPDMLNIMASVVAQ